MRANTKDVATGAVFVAIGLAFGITSLTGLRLGGSRIGPGLFPFVLSIVLCGFGVAVALAAIGKEKVAFGAVPWRGIVLITASVLFFSFALEPLGLAPAVAGCVLLASAATTRSKPLTAILVSLGMAVFCALIFKYALGLNLRVFGTWFGG